MARPQHEAAAGRLWLHHYRRHELIGEGASAQVWSAEDTRDGREVALKVLKASAREDLDRAAGRFADEARALSCLEHPHLLRIHSVEHDADGAPALVMQRLRGETLAAALLRTSKLSPERAFEWLVPIAGALATAHEAGVLHRDVKPANLFLHEEDGATVPTLLDFGAAKLSEGGSQTTTSGMAVGTPCYMAPEQAEGRALGPYTDVWALGVVWFRCLTGGLPFSAETSLAVVIKLSRERAPRFGDVAPDLPAPLCVALDRALEPDPAARYPDVRSFMRALAHAAAQCGIEVPADPDPQALGDWPGWLSEADGEATDMLPSIPAGGAANDTLDPQQQPSADGVDSAKPRQPVSRRRWIAAAALCATTAALLWSLASEGGGSPISEGRAAAAEEDRKPTAGSPAPVARMADHPVLAPPALPQAQPTGSPPPTPAIAAPRQAPQGPWRRPRTARPARKTAAPALAASKTPARNPAATTPAARVAPAKRTVIEDFNW